MVQGERKLHPHRLPHQHCLHILPFIPAAQMGSHQFKVGKPPADSADPLWIRLAHARVGDVVAGVDHQDQAGLRQGRVQRVQARVVEQVVLVVGVHFDALEPLGVYEREVIEQVRVGRVQGGQGDDPLGADGPRPAEDGFELFRPGGDRADYRSVDAGAVHGGEQPGHGAVQVGADAALGLQGRDGGSRDPVGKGVGVEVDDPAHGRIMRFRPAARDRGGGRAGRRGRRRHRRA